MRSPDGRTTWAWLLVLIMVSLVAWVAILYGFVWVSEALP